MQTTYDAQVTAALFDRQGAVFALGDGSIRFVKSTINGESWRALGSMRGGEVISADAL